jgi:hypothetical protein
VHRRAVRARTTGRVVGGARTRGRARADASRVARASRVASWRDDVDGREASLW